MFTCDECLATNPYQSIVINRRSKATFSPSINLTNKFQSPILATLGHVQAQTRPDLRHAPARSANPSFFQALSDLFWHPQRILFLWNWKSAWLSIILRGPIFLAVTIKRGFFASLSALITECIVCAATAGFYGALVQNLRDATPLWLTAVFLVVFVPSVFQGIEYLLHLVRGTPHLRVAEIISVGVSAVSSLFNWYAMRRGALLVGGEGSSFGSDLHRLPKLVFDFFATLPRKLTRSRRTSEGSRDDSASPRSLNP